jgi:hypothetical protein
MKNSFVDPAQLSLFDEVQPENKNNRKMRRIRKGDASSYPAQLDLFLNEEVSKNPGDCRGF